MAETKERNVAKKLELAANVGIVITAILVAILFARNYMQRQADPQHTVPLGSKFALKDVNWQSSEKNLVFAVSTTCHYCTESAGFYRKLVEECKQQHVRTIAVLPQSPVEAKAYLEKEERVTLGLWNTHHARMGASKYTVRPSNPKSEPGELSE